MLISNWGTEATMEHVSVFAFIKSLKWVLDKDSDVRGIKPWNHASRNFRGDIQQQIGSATALQGGAWNSHHLREVPNECGTFHAIADPSHLAELEVGVPGFRLIAPIVIECFFSLLALSNPESMIAMLESTGIWPEPGQLSVSSFKMIALKQFNKFQDDSFETI